jgi:hypothetical protein
VCVRGLLISNLIRRGNQRGSVCNAQEIVDALMILTPSCRGATGWGTRPPMILTTLSIFNPAPPALLCCLLAVVQPDRHIHADILDEGGRGARALTIVLVTLLRPLHPIFRHSGWEGPPGPSLTFPPQISPQGAYWVIFNNSTTRLDNVGCITTRSYHRGEVVRVRRTYPNLLPVYIALACLSFCVGLLRLYKRYLSLRGVAMAVEPLPTPPSLSPEEAEANPAGHDGSADRGVQPGGWVQPAPVHQPGFPGQFAAPPPLYAPPPSSPSSSSSSPYPGQRPGGGAQVGYAHGESAPAVQPGPMVMVAGV